MKNTRDQQRLSFPSIIKGCWQLSKGHSVPFDNATAVEDLVRFAQAGITTFDCADIYAGVEELLGIFRKEYARRFGADAERKLRIHTKFVPNLDALRVINRQYVERIIDRSLKRLEVEQLTLVQFHWWDWNIPRYVETMLHLHELQRAGKILHLGVTNFDVAHLREIVNAGIRIETNQVQYSVLDLRPENGMTDYCALAGIQLLCYGTVAGGFLSEQYLNAPELCEPFANRSLTKYKLLIDAAGDWDMFQRLLQALAYVAKKHRVSIPIVATKFVLEQSSVGAVILGARSARLPDMHSVMTLRLNSEDTALIRAARETGTLLPGDVYELERVFDSSHGRIMRYNLNA